ncbi:MAG: glycosyltransferase family 39 protein [Flavobacteriales bacterium]|nr:glycosyltransferase family 39 protein [Flavobacteriales bacterium]
MKEKHLFWLLFLLLGISLFINVSINPLFLEEPRRAMVALEMYLQNNLLVPTLYGEFYYRKPPVFNWVILGSMQLFSEHPEFACRTVSIVSFLLMGLLSYWFCKKYHSEKLGQMAALLFLTSVHLLFYGSMFAEIDLFYSLITYASILSLFVFYTSEKRLLYFLSIYGLSAIGLLTKGAPSIVFLGIGLLAHFAITRNWKWFFSWQHVLSGLLFLAMLGGFALAYDQYNPIENLVNAVWRQSSDQTVANHGFGKTFIHFLTYPSTVFTDLLPVTLFFPLLFVPTIRKRLWNDPALQFISILFIANIFVYWISPGTRSRYVYMLYPMAVIICSWLFLEASKRYEWVENTLRGLNLFIVAICALAIGTLPLFASQIGLENAPIALAFPSLIPLLVIGYMSYKRRFSTQMWWLIALLIFARFQFDAFVLPARAETGEHMQYRVHGEMIAELTKGKKLWLYKYDTVNDEASLKFGHGFYIEWNRQDVLHSIERKNCEDVFLTQDFEVKNNRYELLYEFDRREDRWLLVRFTDCD